MATFPSIAHVALTVTDLGTSVAWYNKVFDAEPAMELNDGDFQRKVYALPNGQLLGLTAHNVGASGERFSERRPGLDHVSFACADRDEVASWERKLGELGIAHGGLTDAPYGAVLSFKDPDGNALELFAPGQGS